MLLLAGCADQKQAEAPAEPPAPEKPPEVFQVKFETTKGDFVIEVHREWAPRGADHFYHLVTQKFYDGSRFFRVVRRFVAQFGINGDPKTQALYSTMQILDDPVQQSNLQGFVSFAKLGPNSRTTQVFINLKDNSSLDKDGFAPFGKVVEGFENIERLWSSYGEVAPRGTGPDPTQIEIQGNAYLESKFPRLDSIVRTTLILDPVQ
ncbi:MAG: peptidylprolyl isomerase [bacterium]|nr:peptidylprolyl isomerase [bacterium]